MVSNWHIKQRVLAGQKVTGVGFQTNDNDLEALRMLIKLIPGDGPINVIEIGSWVGESALAMIEAAGARAITVHCVDTWQGSSGVTGDKVAELGSEGIYQAFVRNCGPYFQSRGRQRIVPIVAKSPEAADGFANDFADLIFIDGDHSHDAALADVVGWRRVLKPGGILCGHDYEEVHAALKEAGLGSVLTAGSSVWWRIDGDDSVNVTALAQANDLRRRQQEKPQIVGTIDKSKPSVFLCMPHYDGNVNMNAARAFFQNATKGAANIWTPDAGGSLLAHTFNQLYCAALAAYEEGEITHFAMLHADIMPEDGFIDIMLEEMRQHDADLLACISPLKDDSGFTSTAIGDPADRWIATPLHMSEICKLPSTFSIKDTQWGDMELLVNSGCMLVDLSKPWTRALDEEGCLKAYFRILDRVKDNGDGTFTRFVRSEDWEFSRMVRDLGGKVFATRKVQITHFGQMRFVTPTEAEVIEDQEIRKAQRESAQEVEEISTLVNDLLAVKRKDKTALKRVRGLVDELQQLAEVG